MIVILIDLLATCAVFVLLIRYAGRPNVAESKKSIALRQETGDRR
jgi:hypothetical protein